MRKISPIIEASNLSDFIKLNKSIIFLFVKNYCEDKCNYYPDQATLEDLYGEVCLNLAKYRGVEKYRPNPNNTWYTYITKILNNAMSMAIHQGGKHRIIFEKNLVHLNEELDAYTYTDRYTDIEEDIDCEKFSKWLEEEMKIDTEVLDYLLEGWTATQISKFIEKNCMTITYYKQKMQVYLETYKELESLEML